MRDPLNLTLSGVPELELFPNVEERERALRELSGASHLPRRLWWRVGVTIILMFAFAMTIRWVLFSAVGLSQPFAVPAYVLCMFLLVWFSVRLVHRWIFRENLRSKLVELGVPICMACGYPARGLKAGTDCCPECGRTFNALVQALVDRPAGG